MKHVSLSTSPLSKILRSSGKSKEFDNEATAGYFFGSFLKRSNDLRADTHPKTKTTLRCYPKFSLQGSTTVAPRFSRKIIYAVSY